MAEGEHGEAGGEHEQASREQERAQREHKAKIGLRAGAMRRHCIFETRGYYT